MLEPSLLVQVPIAEPVTKFGGQPVWLASPTWPLTDVGTPITFVAQFRLPWRDEALAYLFLDLAGFGMSEDGSAASFVQPESPPTVPYEARTTGPTYPRERSSDPSWFRVDVSRELIESVPDLTPGFDPEDWDAEPLGRDDDRDRNKLGGTPRWLQGDEHPGDGHRFVFQFSAGQIGYELGDAAECYGFVDPDGQGIFTWQCH
jgi:hypothetical protein